MKNICEKKVWNIKLIYIFSNFRFCIYFSSCALTENILLKMIWDPGYSSIFKAYIFPCNADEVCCCIHLDNLLSFHLRPFPAGILDTLLHPHVPGATIPLAQMCLELMEVCFVDLLTGNFSAGHLHLFASVM